MSEDLKKEKTQLEREKQQLQYQKADFEKYYENGSCLVTDKRLAKQVIDEFRDVLIGE